MQKQCQFENHAVEYICEDYSQHSSSIDFNFNLCCGLQECLFIQFLIFPVALVVKYLLANAGDIRITGSIPDQGRPLGGEQGNTHQYSCLENPHGLGVLWATAQRVAKSQTQLKQLSMHIGHFCCSIFRCQSCQQFTKFISMNQFLASKTVF